MSISFATLSLAGHFGRSAPITEACTHPHGHTIALVKPVLVLRHEENCPLGLLGDALEAASIPWVEASLRHGAAIPPLDGFSALISLGGAMGAYDEADYPWLADEKRAIAEAHEMGMPMLGICLGAQLFAESLGGAAYLADGIPEIRHFTPTLTAAGAADPVLRHFDTPVVVFHQDTWDPPPDATLLARSDRFNHAFRLDSALAIQAHPEADGDIVESWTTMDEERPLLEAAGTDSERLIAQTRDGEGDQREMASRLFGAWVDEVRAHASAGEQSAKVSK